MPVKIVKTEQNGGLWPFKDQGEKSIFFYHKIGSSSHQTASFELLRIKIGSAVQAIPARVKVREKFLNKAQTIVCWVS